MNYGASGGGFDASKFKEVFHLTDSSNLTTDWETVYEINGYGYIKKAIVYQRIGGNILEGIRITVDDVIVLDVQKSNIQFSGIIMNSDISTVADNTVVGSYILAPYYSTASAYPDNISINPRVALQEYGVGAITLYDTLCTLTRYQVFRKNFKIEVRTSNATPYMILFEGGVL